MLDNAIQAIDDLRQVRITQSTLCQQSGQLPSFQQYLDLLNNTAVVYNSHQQAGSTGRPDTSARRVYLTHGEYNNSDLDDVYEMGMEADDAGFDIDSPLSTITAFGAQQRRPSWPSGPPDPSTCLPDSAFSPLAVDDKCTWSRLSEDARRVILSLTKNGESPHPTTGIGGLSSSNRRVLIADQSSNDEFIGDVLAPEVSGNSNSSGTDLIAMMSNRHHPGNVRRLLLSSSSAPTTLTATPTQQVNTTQTYSVARSQSNPQRGALIDRGANGGLAGTDCRIIAKCPDQFVNIEGIDRHQLLHVPIVTCGAYTLSQNHGPVIVVFHQFVGMQRGPTIISSAQLESYFNVVNDRSRRLDPTGQLITTNDGFEFPLHFRQGLPYLDMRPYIWGSTL